MDILRAADRYVGLDSYQRWTIRWAYPFDGFPEDGKKWQGGWPGPVACLCPTTFYNPQFHAPPSAWSCSWSQVFINHCAKMLSKLTNSSCLSLKSWGSLRITRSHWSRVVIWTRIDWSLNERLEVPKDFDVFAQKFIERSNGISCCWIQRTKFHAGWNLYQIRT